jgi:anti-anti-sigma factor
MTRAARTGHGAADPKLVVQRSESAGEVVLELAGEFDLTGVDRFEQAVADIAPGANVRVELAGLDFLDSSGVRALINLDARSGAGGHTTLSAPQPHVRRLLDMCSLGESFEIVD